MIIKLSKLTPDPIDPRDYLFEPNPGDILFGSSPNVTLPNSVDLRNFCTPIESQGSIGDCTAASVCGCAEMFDHSVDRSKLFNYYTSRQIIGPPYDSLDAGSTARAALKAASQSGLPNESLWPNNPAMWSSKPSQAAYDDALLHKVTKYYRIQTLNSNQTDVIKSIKYSMSIGYPVMISANVGTTMQNSTTTAVYQRVSYPANPIWGKHMFILVGFDDDGQYFIAKNSWGTSYRESGYFKVSYEMAYQDTLDLWVMKGFNGINTVGPNQIMYPPKPSTQDIVAFINMYLSTDVQYIIDTAIWYHLSARDLEIAMGWANGSILLYSQSFGSTLNWHGFIW